MVRKCFIRFRNKWFHCAFNLVWAAEGVNKSMQNGTRPDPEPTCVYATLLRKTGASAETKFV